MGILDNIIQSGENQAEVNAENKIRNAVNSGFNKVGSKPQTGTQGNASKCPSCKAQLPTPMPRFCPKCGAKALSYLR